MSLFDELRRLYAKDKFPLEDFHTEIVAQVLRDSPSLTLAWLRGIGATFLQTPVLIKVATQQEFSALAGHDTDSRPDVAVRLVQGDRVELILIESKIGAKEGFNQLQRYAEHLQAQSGIDATALVFITRDFEPPRSFPGLPASFTFRQTRWHDFFHYLKAHVNGDGLASQLKLFMENNRMSLRNQFTAIDSLALGNFPAAKSLMDETLWGEVSRAFEKTLGKVNTPKKAMIQLHDHNRYVLAAGFGSTYDMECLLGYFLPSDDPAEPAWLGLALNSNPKSPIRPKVIGAFRAFAHQHKATWEQDALSDEKEWATIYRGEDLPTFMHHGDHVAAIKSYFLELLGEVKQFKAQSPCLPWLSSSTEDNEE